MSNLKKFSPAVAVLVAAFVVIGVGSYAVAQFTSVFGTTNVETQHVYVGNSEASVSEEQVLGRIDASVRDRFGGYTSINIEEELRFGDNDKVSDGYSMGFKVFDLDATTTASELNNTGETIYVYDGYIRVQTATSTAVAYRVGTTSAGIVDDATQCGATGTCDAATAQTASLIFDATAQTTSVGDTFFKADYQGTDTTDGVGTRIVTPVLDGEYITAYASTSPSANLQAGGQAAQIVIKYYTLDD